jgi:fumarate reductase flavoprotein subunit
LFLRSNFMKKFEAKIFQIVKPAALVAALVFAVSACAGGARTSGAFDSSYDIIVVGAGGAGLSAAITAKEAGANVVVFEKMSIPGGNTIRATGGINAAGSQYQIAAGVNDSVELFYDDTMRGGQNLNDPALVRLLAERSVSSIEWLGSIGADLSDVGRMAGASVNRVHRPTGGAQVGPEISTTLEHHAIEVMNVPIITNAEVTSINMQRGRVTGVQLMYRGRQHSVSASAVILATGGFGANNEMAASLVPELRGFATTNQPGALGEGIVMARRVGAAFVDMEQIQTHPTHAPEKEMITEAVRGNGAIMVNRAGVRFVDELATRDVVSERILAQEGASAFLVFDDSVRRSLAAIESYVRLGIVLEAPTPEALGALIGGAAEGALSAAVNSYNQGQAYGNDHDFGRANMPRSLSVPPYYAIEVVPAIHHTMGGVKIDTEARVLSTSGVPIPGFYAAGEVTGGIHGANRLGGNALADIIAFGRIAGTSAVAGR